MNTHIWGWGQNDKNWAGTGKPAAGREEEAKGAAGGGRSCWKGPRFAEFQHSSNFDLHHYSQFQF